MSVSLSRVPLFETPWTVARQAPLSMGFARKECWSGLPFLSPGDLPDPEIKPMYPALQVDSLPSKKKKRGYTSEYTKGLEGAWQIVNDIYGLFPKYLKIDGNVESERK